MDGNEYVNHLIESVGALAELTKIHYDAFLAVGFTEAQSLALAVEILKEAMRNNSSTQEKDYD